jgi:hypothetical protein
VLVVTGIVPKPASSEAPSQALLRAPSVHKMSTCFGCYSTIYHEKLAYFVHYFGFLGVAAASAVSSGVSEDDFGQDPESARIELSPAVVKIKEKLSRKPVSNCFL